MHPELSKKPWLDSEALRRKAADLLAKRSVGRFLLVGIANTIFGFSFFPILHLATQDVLSFDAALVISYVVCSTVSFLTHRLITFQSQGALAGEIVRYGVLAFVTYALNRLALWLLADVLPIPLLATQMLIAAGLLVLTYLGLARVVFALTGVGAPGASDVAQSSPQKPVLPDTKRRY